MRVSSRAMYEYLLDYRVRNAMSSIAVNYYTDYSYFYFLSYWLRFPFIKKNRELTGLLDSIKIS